MAKRELVLVLLLCADIRLINATQIVLHPRATKREKDNLFL
jgi:hypothetical protein